MDAEVGAHSEAAMDAEVGVCAEVDAYAGAAMDAEAGGGATIGAG